MYTRDSTFSELDIIVIDLSQLNLNNADAYIQSKSEHNKWVANVDGNITIQLFEHNADFEIIFGDVNIDDCHIRVLGGSNNILISNSNIYCRSIELNCCLAVLGKDCHFKTLLTELNSDEVEIDGSIDTIHMATNIAKGKPGVTNFGDLTVTDTYVQRNGSFENFNIFKSHQLAIENGMIIANHEDAVWDITHTQEINGKSFVNKGEFQGKHSAIKCDIILLKNDISNSKVIFKGETAVLDGSEMVLIASSVECSIGNLLCQSKKSVILESKFQNSILIQAIAETIKVKSSAKFVECADIKLKALSLLKCESGIVTHKVSNFVTAAKRLHIGSSLTVDTNIMLASDEYSVIEPGVILKSPHLTLLAPDADVFIYGTLSGQVHFPEKLRHLYLPKNSTIENCPNLKLESKFIQAYGNVQSAINLFNAESSIFTDLETEVDGSSTAMLAEFIYLAGKLAGKELYCKSSLQISMSPELSLTLNKFVADSPAIALKGIISCSIDLASKELINQATITNDTYANFQVEVCQVHQSESVVTSEDVQMNGKAIIHHGTLTANHAIHEQASDIYNSRHSTLSSPDINIHGDTILQGGRITGGTTANLAASNTCGFLVTNEISTESFNVHAGNQLAGALNLNADKVVASGHHYVEFISGNMVVKNSLTVSSGDLLLDSNIRTQKLILAEMLNPEDNDETHANLGRHSSITTNSFAENFSTVTVSGMLDADKAIFESKSAVTIEVDANLVITHQFAAKTKKFGFQGRLTQACKAVSENDGIYIEATCANFESYSNINAKSPMYVSVDDVRYAGHVETRSITTQADATLFDRDCYIPRSTGEVKIIGKSPSAIVTVGKGAKVDSQLFRVDEIDKLTVTGILSSNKIIVKVNDIQVDLHGQLGDYDSSLNLESETLKLDGLLEGSEANIKCHLVFLQNWLNGRATLRVRRLNLTAPFYINFLGKTESQQASFTSLLYLCFGFEFINFKTNNSIVKINVLPKLIHIEFLTNIITDIKDGKINILNASYLQSTLQTILSILQPFLPTVTLAANIAVNSYFMINNINQLVTMVKSLSETKNIKLVDLLPLLVTIKNTISAGRILVDNVVTFADRMKDPALDAIEDIGNYLGNDFLNDIKDIFHVHQDKNDKEHPANVQTNPVIEKPSTPVKEPHVVPVTSKLEKLKAWVHDINPSDALDDVFTKGLMAPLSILLPSSFEDALINIDLLSPILTGTSNQRGIFTFSFGSRVVGLSSNKTGIFALADYSRHFVYSESMSGHYVLKGQDSYAHIFNSHADKFEQSEGTKIRSAYAIIDEKNARPHDVKASKNLTFKYETVDNEIDFLQLKSIYDVYRPEGEDKPLISYDTNHSLKFYQNFTLPWSVSYKGSDIFVNQGVTITSNGDTLGLVSSKNSIVMKGKLVSGKTIFESSADKIEQDNGTTNSAQLYMSARHNIDLIRSNNTADEGAIVSARGHVWVDAGNVKFKHFGYVSAHNDVIASCQSASITHNKSSDKEYTAGVIEGGDGLHHDNVGLVVHADNQILNKGSYIGAVGDYILDGVHGIVGIAFYNDYVKELKHDKTYLIINKDHKVTSLHIQSPTFESRTGKCYLYSRRGTVNTLCAKILSKTATKIFTHDAPIFRDINVSSIEDNSISVAGIMLNSDHHEQNELVGQVFVAPESLNVECLYGDIVIPNSSIDTQYLVTDAWVGNTYIYQTPTDHILQSSYLTVSSHLGPLNISLAFNPDDHHPFKIWVQDPIVDLAINGKNIKGKEQAASTLLNTADSVAGKLTKDKDGRYTHLVDTTVGTNIGYTSTTSQYQTPGNNHIYVGYWDDFSANGVSIENMPGSIGVLDIHCGQTFTVNGKPLTYSNSTSTMTAGGSFDLLSKQVDISASLSQSKSEGQFASPCQVQINRLIFRKEVELSLNNAQLKVNKLHGKISNLGLFSAQDINTQSSSTVSASLSGNVGVSQSAVYTREVNSPSFLDVNDLSDCQIDHVTNNGGELRGAGFSKISPDRIDELGLRAECRETGFSLSVNALNGIPQSVGYKSDSMSFTLNMPNNLTKTLASFKRETNDVDNIFPEQNQINDHDVILETIEMTDSTIINDVNESIEDAVSAAMNSVDIRDETVQPDIPVTFYQKPNYVLYQFGDSYSTTHMNATEHAFHLDFPWPEEFNFIFGIGRTQDGKTDYLYRGDLRNPEYIFENGFIAKGKNKDLMRHVRGKGGEAPHDSAYISTTAFKDIAKAFPVCIPEEGTTKSYVYVINKRSHAIDVDTTLQKMAADPDLYMYDEAEFAIKNKIKPRDIKGAYQNERIFEEGNMGPTHKMDETLLKNPHYRPLWTTSDYVLAGFKGGSFVMLSYGAYEDSHGLYDAYLTSCSTHSPHPLASETSRVAAAWTGAFLAGEAVMPFVAEFAAAAGFAFPVTTAACLVFSIVTSSLGYTIAGEIGKVTYDNGVTTANTLINVGKQLIRNGEFSYRTLRATGQALFNHAPIVQFSPDTIIPLSFKLLHKI